MPTPHQVLFMLRDRASGRGRLLRAKPRTPLGARARRSPESLEERLLLSADPIEFGAVYVEQDLGSDANPDTIEVSFTGGAPGTELTRIDIDGDKFAPGLSLADMLFDTQAGGIGADLSFDGLITNRIGEFTSRIVVADGSSQLAVELSGFEAGDKLWLSIDVDEMQGYQPDTSDIDALNDELDPIASGAEFHGSQLTASFSAPHFYDATGSAEFRNRYDDLLLPTSLDLPLDDESGNRDRTAGAVGTVAQQPLPIGISGHVYEDRDADLVRDADDPWLADVELALYTLEGGAFVFTGHTTRTGTDGSYAFREDLGLLPGDYEIRETQPAGYFSVGAIPGEVDGERTGRATSPDVLTSISIPHGGLEAENFDFAEARPASLRGRVQLSTPDGDCFSDDIEHRPVADVVVQLQDAQGQLIQETRTNENGEYAFADLRPGSYTVVEITPGHLIEGGAQAGFVSGERVGQAAGSEIREVRLHSGEQAVDYDFCEHEPASLSGHVYHDRDDDGIRDVGEEGIAEALISLLDETDEVIASTRSSTEGQYEFVGLRAGNYRVIELQPTGWLDGKDRAGTVDGTGSGAAVNPGDAIRNISLGWGSVGRDYDFGELLPTGLEGRVHLSGPDGDCWNLDEDLLEPVAGARVQLLDIHGQVLAETLTDAQGEYSFGDLAPGEYQVREITPAELADGGARAGQVAGITRGTVVDGMIQNIRLNSGQRGIRYDFCEHPLATLSGHVYEDDNNDGQLGSGEAPIAGVRLELWNEQGELVATTQTDAQGRYAFHQLPSGRYTVREVQPEGYLDGLDQAGVVNGERRGHAINPGDQISDIWLGWGERGTQYNFGELRPASLEGRVHSSTGPDCFDDPDAIPLAGVTVRLWGEQGRLVAETTTNEGGRYRFDGLAPGRYAVEEVQPDGVFDGGQRAGSHGGNAQYENAIREIDLPPGVQAVDYDFCETPPSSVSGYVFVDGPPLSLLPGETLPEDLTPLRDGKRTPDDRPLAGITLELRNGITGAELTGEHALPGRYDADVQIRTVTDERGFYAFTGLPKGSYAVYQVHPTAYTDGIDTPGTTDGVAMNPIPLGEDDILIETIRARLVEPPGTDAIVLIGVRAGEHSRDNNFSEILVEDAIPYVPSLPPQPLPEPVTPLLELPALLTLERDLAPLPLESFQYISDGSHSGYNNTWHLSVIDGGQPRLVDHPSATNQLYPASLWQQRPLDEVTWSIQRDGTWQTHVFGTARSIPIAGDFNGDGSAEMGIFVDGHWYIDINGNGRWDGQDLWAKLGHHGDTPVVGDWDGDGKDDIGIFGRAWPGDPRALRSERGLPDMENVPDGSPKNMPPEVDEATLGKRVMKLTARGRLREDVIDHVFLYGAPSDHGVVGDWNGDGIDTVGIYRHGFWLLDVDGNGHWSDPDEAVRFGGTADLPIVGDFNGDGLDDLAILRDGKIIIDANRNRVLDSADVEIPLPEDGTHPVAGKWAGQAADTFAWFQTEPREHITVANRKDSQ